MGTRRPGILPSIKDLVWARDGGVCRICGAKIASRDQAQFNHQPGLWVRERNHAYKETNSRHYIPNANDPDYIFTVHSSQTSAEKCHDQQTFGNGVYRGDVTEAARTKAHLQKKNGTAKPKQKMQSRPFDKRHRPMPGSKAHPSKLRVRMNKKVEQW